ncbi:MAG: hypothetical protein Q9195_007660 [Heterodermia aff. obscurata]
MVTVAVAVVVSTSGEVTGTEVTTTDVVVDVGNTVVAIVLVGGVAGEVPATARACHFREYDLTAHSWTEEPYAVVGIACSSLHQVQRISQASLPTKQLQISLAELFGLTIKREHNDAAEIEGQTVKQYSLSQSRAAFEYLMRDSTYASETQELLRDTARNRAFLVTGFITTSSTTLKRTSGRKVEYGFNISMPISSASGGSAMLDPQLAPSVSSDISVSQETILPDDCIFAMSYDIITLTRKFDIQAPKFVQHSIQHRGLKRAKPQHLAMGRDDESNEEIEIDEEEIKEPPDSIANGGNINDNLGKAVEHVEELEYLSQI